PDFIMPNRDGTLLATMHQGEIAIIDPNGVPRWHETVWGTQMVQFTGDERRLLVRTSGGLIALDAATGKRVAAACGFGFGLLDKEPQLNTLGVTPVCEDVTR